MVLVALVLLLSVSVVTLLRCDQELISGASKSLGYRLQYWRSTLSMISDHPWFGCGPGNFQYEYTRYKLPEASEEIADPHNFFMEVWATAGTPTAVVFLMILGGIAWRMRTCVVHDSSTRTGWGRKNESILSVEDERSTLDPTGPWYVYGGAILGCLLALPFGSISSGGPSQVAILLGLPLIIGVIVLLHRWVLHGRLPLLLPGVAVVAMLINLSAAGGIGYPSVAGSFWLLLAIGLNISEQWQWRLAPRPVALGGFILMALLVFACYQTAYSPVGHCSTLMRRAFWEPNMAEAYLADAGRADPLAAKPWQQLAVEAFSRWCQDPQDTAFGLFQRSTALALELSPHAAVSWAAAGRQYGEAFFRTGQEQYARQAVGMWREAVQLYPNSAEYQAQLALSLQEINDLSAARRHVEMALELDGLTPHADKKLSAELRKRLAELLKK